ncbi:MBL fold metallo-hydrolase [Microbacterium sp. NPDC077184]|uniref:MBL fold metallo-hydrolase n=1 Tax=Microbacterium sp. NPDC077184 TaxID=3154764 RepID=UPI00343E9E5B
MRVITLGTAGGPRWWSGPERGRRAGIATAVEVDGQVYLVDVGLGTGRQLMMSGCEMSALRGIFLTHLHSDHVIDLPSILLFGSIVMTDLDRQVPVIGPGDRGILPPVSPRAKTPPAPVAADQPTPGTKLMVQRIVEAFATDINDRVLNALRPSPADLFDPREIDVPTDVGYHPNDNPFPDMEPFVIFEDEWVTVSAILVAHAPMTPAFAFRFDSRYGSVTISGDTAPCDNVVRLARGSDLLLHEAIDFDWVDSLYRGHSADFAAASVDHHRRSHTSVKEALRIAERAEVGTLAIHHLVPGARPTEEWIQAGAGSVREFLVPDDLDVIEIPRGRS